MASYGTDEGFTDWLAADGPRQLDLKVYHAAGVSLNVSNASWVKVELFEDLT